MQPRTSKPARNRRAVWAAGAVLAVTALIVGVGLSARPHSHPAAVAQPVPHDDVVPSSVVHEAADPDERLPDLDQEAPSELDVHAGVSAGAPTYRLGFRSAVRNIGAGPLTVEGARADTTTPTMTVDQIIDRVSGPPRVVPAVGEMEYSVSPDHSHWHYLQFDRYQLQRYELRSAGSGDVLVADQKTGFCLGDRYRIDPPVLAAAPAEPVFRGGCGLSHPELLNMREGISVGYGDDYSGFLEGQDLPLDGLPDGRYVLVHRVNANDKLHEISYANNAASVLLDLRWANGRPLLHALASCPDTDRCDSAPADEVGLEIPLTLAP